MTLTSRRNSQEFPTSLKELQHLLSAYRNFAKRELKRPLISTRSLDEHILSLNTPPNTSKLTQKSGNLYDVFCIYGVKKHKLVQKFEEKNLIDKVINKLSKGEELRMSCHVDLNYYDIIDPSASEISKKVMVDSRDIIYQNNVEMKPLWTRESMNNVAFRREKNGKRYFVVPLSSGFGGDGFEYPESIRRANPCNIDYLVGVFVSDFVNLPRIEPKSSSKKVKSLWNKMTKKSKTKKVIEGFNYDKAIVFKTKVPHHRFWFQVLEMIISKVKIERSSILSSKLMEGETLEEMDLEQFDSEFSDKLLQKVYESLKGNFPKIENFENRNNIVLSDGKFSVVNYSNPGTELTQFLECHPGCLKFLKACRFEELWYLVNIILNERKLIFISDDISLLGSAILTLFCIIKPFKWQYPYFIYSKDANLIDSPFPLIMGISRSLYKRIRKAPFNDDTYFFDLQTSQLYSSPKTKDRVAFFSGKNLQKLASLHRGFLNNEVSRFYEILKLNGNVRFRGNAHVMIESTTPVAEIEDLDRFLRQYFGLFRDMLESRFMSLFTRNSFRDRESFLAKVLQGDVKQNEFLKVFLGTQMFGEFLEDMFQERKAFPAQ